jgi:hypothetical protein
MEKTDAGLMNFVAKIAVYSTVWWGKVAILALTGYGALCLYNPAHITKTVTRVEYVPVQILKKDKGSAPCRHQAEEYERAVPCRPPVDDEEDKEIEE